MIDALIDGSIHRQHGPEWHCLVGKVKAFSVHVRYVSLGLH